MVQQMAVRKGRREEKIVMDIRQRANVKLTKKHTQEGGGGTHKKKDYRRRQLRQ